MASVYRPLKENIEKLQRANEGLTAEIAELRLSLSVNQEKLRTSLNKLDANDQELLASLNENCTLARKLRDSQQENAILLRNLRENESMNQEISQKNRELVEKLAFSQEIFEKEAKKSEFLEEKTAEMCDKLQKNEQFLEKHCETNAFLKEFSSRMHEFLESTLRKMLHFSINLDKNSRLLQKNSQQSLDFIVKAQNYLANPQEKRAKSLENLEEAFDCGIFSLEEGLKESLEELCKEIETNARNSSFIEKMQRDLQSLQREAVFKEDENQELARELQRVAENKEIIERDKEKSVKE